MRIAGKLAGLVLFLGSASGLISCGGGSAGSEGPPLNPVPSISAIAPASTNTGGAGFTLTVNGSGFIATSVVRWNGSDRRTTFVGSTQLTASIPAGDITSGGTAQVHVFNPAPGGGTSGAATFAINNAAPTVSTLSPSTQTAGGAAFTLMVTGSGFVSSSVVRWNGSDRTTTFISSTQLSAAIPAGDIASGATAQIQVFNPAPGGGTSGSLEFAIQNPVPAITLLSPTSILVGGPSFDLSVSGTNFVPGSVVQWNGSTRPTSFQNSSLLLASIPAGDISSVGGAAVTVVNPAPGGGTSASISFTISVNPVPIIASISPFSTGVGAPSFSLRVTGSNFLPTSVVEWNGGPRTTSFQTSMLLLATIPASDLASAGIASIAVVNPSPGGGTSNTLPFSVNNPMPAITSFSPSSAPAGGADFTLTIEGGSFVPGVVVRWNDSDRPTTLVSSTQLTAVISAGDIAAPGIAAIQAVNQSPGGGPSHAAGFITNPPGLGVLERISVASDGAEANGDSFEPSVSGDGRFVAFASSATNLVPGDLNGVDDIFLRDTCLGAPPACTLSTIRISVADNGEEANGKSSAPSVSDDGRYVVFRSSATNLVPGDLNGVDDIFLRDTCLGAVAPCTPSTVRVSVTETGGEADGPSVAPKISGNGRIVAFQSFATNLVVGQDNTPPSVFLRDTCRGASAGCTQTTIWLGAGNGAREPVISADGQFVAFHEPTPVPGLPPEEFQTEGAFLVRTCIGAPSGCVPGVVFASDLPPSLSTCDFAWLDVTSRPSISPGGSFLVFSAQLRDGCGHFPSESMYSFDLFDHGGTLVQIPVLDGSLQLFPEFGGGSSPVANGLIAYLSASRTGVLEILSFGTFCSGGRCTDISLLSVAGDGTPANGSSSSPALSADGRFVVFMSGATNLVASDSNSVADVFIARTGRP